MTSGWKQSGRTAVTPSDVLDFWFDLDHRTFWFKSTDAFDGEIKRRFAPTAQLLADPVAVTGINWRADPRSHLAEIIVLDQFPRNMYRGTPEAFAWDPLALAVANVIVEQGRDMALSDPDERKFAYMPFMHSEALTDQNRCVELAGSRLDDEGSTLRHAIAHRDVIERFGRFPHRNAVLGRKSTPEEVAFLKGGGYNPS
ncbi:MAG: DUF924 family protein [Pseudomonadota bacterium]